MIFKGSRKLSNYFLGYLFPASLVLALSVVSMKMFAPHKMEEIRANGGVPDPRMELYY